MEALFKFKRFNRLIIDTKKIAKKTVRPVHDSLFIL